MRIINFHHLKFSIGQAIVVIKEYKNGGTHLRIGEVGSITDITIQSLPDFGLFDIRVIHFKFGKHEFGLNQASAEEYMDEL